MTDWALAFFTGLLGSFHCLGMCGPLAFSVPTYNTNRWLILLDKLMYQVGRIISYSFLGLLVGLLGKQLWMAGMQQGISILTGALIFIAALSRLLKTRWARNAGELFLSPFNKLLRLALEGRSNHLIIGILNGFLPCGFVYLALAGAINTGKLLSSVQYMFWFGLGTAPLMLIAMFGVGIAGPALRRSINKGIPFIMLIIGIWFILRGMSLNVPYLSPAELSEGVICK